jgi:hypothetical protein
VAERHGLRDERGINDAPINIALRSKRKHPGDVQAGDTLVILGGGPAGSAWRRTYSEKRK